MSDMMVKAAALFCTRARDYGDMIAWNLKAVKRLGAPPDALDALERALRAAERLCALARQYEGSQYRSVIPPSKEREGKT